VDRVEPVRRSHRLAADTFDAVVDEQLGIGQTCKEILEYAVANRIPFREDSSNRSTKYLRNKIRLEMPVSPRSPVPRSRLMKNVSIESSAWWAIATAV